MLRQRSDERLNPIPFLWFGEAIVGRFEGRSARRVRGKGSERLGVLLIVSVVLTILLYTVPALRRIAYPLLLLSTYAHEMGHGVAAWLVGGRFHALVLNADGSGMALMSLPQTRMAAAVSSAGGLLGPPIAASVLWVLGTRRRWATAVLWAMCALSVLMVLAVVRSAFGVFFVLSFAGLCALLARFASEVMQQFWIVFIATQLGLAVYSRADYLFTPYADTARGRMPSDVMQISEALIGPYWFWGGLIAVFSAAILFWGMRFYIQAIASEGRS